MERLASIVCQEYGTARVHGACKKKDQIQGGVLLDTKDDLTLLVIKPRNTAQKTSAPANAIFSRLEASEFRLGEVGGGGWGGEPSFWTKARSLLG